MQSGAAEVCILHYTYGQDLNEDGSVFTPRHCPGPNCTRGFWHWDKRDYTQRYPPRDIPLPRKCQVLSWVLLLLFHNASSRDRRSSRATVYVSSAAVHASVVLNRRCRLMRFVQLTPSSSRCARCLSRRSLCRRQGAAVPTLIAATNEASAAIEPWGFHPLMTS